MSKESSSRSTFPFRTAPNCGRSARAVLMAPTAAHERKRSDEGGKDGGGDSLVPAGLPASRSGRIRRGGPERICGTSDKPTVEECRTRR